MPTDRYKLIHYYALDEWELFDLYQDSMEMNNLYGQAQYRDLSEELKFKLDSLRKMYADTIKTGK